MNRRQQHAVAEGRSGITEGRRVSGQPDHLLSPLAPRTRTRSMALSEGST